MDGYSSTSLNKSVARKFAYLTDESIPVLLSITIKNESGKHYFSLDTTEFTNYPEEKEILLQAGLIFQFVSIEQGLDITIINLKTSEAMIRNFKRKQAL